MTTTFKRPAFVKVMTPVGIAVFPKLNQPDTKFKAEGQFGVRLRLSAEEAQPIIDKYNSVRQAHFEAIKADLMAGDGKAKAKAKTLKLAADNPFKPEMDEETGDETGFVLLNFKMPHRVAREGKPDLLLYPDIFDAKGKQLKPAPEIWGGSKLRVSGELRPFNTAIGVGVSLRLQAVQIIELVSRGSRDAAGYGFGVEDGYEANEMPASEDAPSSDNEAGGNQAHPGDF